MHNPLLIGLCFACLARGALGQCGTWSNATILTSIPTRYNVDSNLTVDSAGKVHLIFQSFLSPNGDNYYINNVSGSWSTPFDLGTMGDKGSTPKIVITPDAQLHAFYGKNNLYWRTKPVTGGSWSTAVEIATNPTGSNFIDQVTVDSTGGIYFVWGHLFDNTAPARNGIYGRYKPLGGAWQSTELIYGNSNDGDWPSATDITANGTTLWLAIEMNAGVYFKTKSVSGSWPAGLGTQLVAGGGALRFAFSPVGSEIAALYHQSAGGGESDPWYEVYAKYSTNGGSSWSSPDNISQQRNDIDRTPSPAYDSNGNLHVLWESFCCSHQSHVRYRGRINGQWGQQIELSGLQGGHIPRSLVPSGLNLFATFSCTGTPDPYDVLFTSYAADTRLTINKTSFAHTIIVNGNVADDTFTVTNGCAGTLNYNINGNASWLTVSPSSGSSTNNIDTITVSYPGASSLHAGTYNATITISGNAGNSPQTITVQLIVRTVRPDFDGDGDVDQSDFAHFQSCLTGANVTQANPSCLDACLDTSDLDVDADDLVIFLGCFSGADVQANVNCAPLYP